MCFLYSKRFDTVRECRTDGQTDGQTEQPQRVVRFLVAQQQLTLLGLYKGSSTKLTRTPVYSYCRLYGYRTLTNSKMPKVRKLFNVFLNHVSRIILLCEYRSASHCLFAGEIGSVFLRSERNTDGTKQKPRGQKPGSVAAQAAEALETPYEPIILTVANRK